jgi:hypothetical protein
MVSGDSGKTRSPEGVLDFGMVREGRPSVSGATSRQQAASPSEIRQPVGRQEVTEVGVRLRHRREKRASLLRRQPLSLLRSLTWDDHAQPESRIPSD